MKTLAISLIVVTLAACSATPPAANTGTPPRVGMANPASVACVQQGGTVDMRKDSAGNVTGYCRFSDGRICEEWALFRDHRCVAPPEDKR